MYRVCAVCIVYLPAQDHAKDAPFGYNPAYEEDTAGNFLLPPMPQLPQTYVSVDAASTVWVLAVLSTIVAGVLSRKPMTMKVCAVCSGIFPLLLTMVTVSSLKNSTKIITGNRISNKNSKK